jgi:integrase/recombinase XerD
MQLHPLISIILDTREANKNKLYPVKLRATFHVSKKKWIQRYFSLKVYCSEKDFAAAKSKPISNKQKDIRKKLVEAESKANRILESHSYVNAELFARLYTSAGNLESVESVFDLKIAELEKAGKIGTADLYRSVKNSILSNTPGLTFYEISSDWIRKYVTWLKENKLGETTVGIYLRHLRAIYNKAIDTKVIKPDLYPFGRGGYTIQKTRARKIALSEEDKNRLIEIKDPELRLAADMWLLSYYCYGLNMTDILSLKVKDLINDLLMISRGKTGNDLVIPIRKEVKEIILRHGNRTLNPNDYVFPILNGELTARQIKNRVKEFVNSINYGLKKVEAKLKLKIRLTTYTARHTFANIALKKGASKEFIQDALGHSSILTTENYLAGFDVEEKRAISDKL